MFLGGRERKEERSDHKTGFFLIMGFKVVNAGVLQNVTIMVPTKNELIISISSQPFSLDKQMGKYFYIILKY